MSGLPYGKGAVPVQKKSPSFVSTRLLLEVLMLHKKITEVSGIHETNKKRRG
jgi:hypothetical protein